MCVDEDSGLDFSNLQHFHLQVSHNQKNRKLFNLLKTLKFNQVSVGFSGSGNSIVYDGGVVVVLVLEVMVLIGINSHNIFDLYTQQIL